MTWVIRNGEVVEKGGPKDVRLQPARSDLPCPMLQGDTMDAVQHPCTGEYLTSKSRFREVTRAHGCVEVGNEKLKPLVKPQPDRKAIRRSIEKAFARA